MTTELISAEVRQFVFDHIDSVSEHEALLLLRKFAARKVDARRSMSDNCPSAAK